MKRILSFILCALLLLSCTACDGDDPKTPTDESMKYVSELRYYHFVGNSDNYYCEMYGGKCETPSIMDGKVGEMSDYVKIKVLPKGGQDAEYKFHIGIDEEEFEGQLVKEVSGGYYTITLKAKELEDQYVLTIIAGDKEEKITLNASVKASDISWDKAKSIAESELKDKIAEITAKGDPYEINIKYIEAEVGSKEYFWYVAFLNDKTLTAVLIDPQNGKVMAKRI